MKAVTARTSPTLASERLVPPLGRSCDVCRIGVAPTGDASEAGRLGRGADLPHRGARPRLVLQVVAPLSSRRRPWAARPLACAQSQLPGCVGRDAPSHPQDSRPVGAAAWSTRTLSVG